MASGFAMTIVNVAVTGIGYPVYLHFLGYEKYGVWLILATIISFVQLSNLGIGPAVMKLVAEEKARGGHQGIQQYVTTAMLIITLSGISALFVILCFKPQIISIFSLNNNNAIVAGRLLPYMGVLSIYAFIVQVFSAALSGLGRMDLSNYSDSAGRIVALVVSFFLLRKGWGIESLLIGSAISYAIVHLILLYMISCIDKYNFVAVKNFNAGRLKKMFRFGSGMFGSSIVSMLLGPFNKLIISRWVGVSGVPVYEIAFNGSMQIRSLIEAVFRSISPEISMLSTRNDGDSKERMRDINRRALKIIWLIGAPFWLMVIMFTKPLLEIWLGARFVAALPPVFQTMLIGTFAGLLCVPAFYTLMGLGNTRHIFIGNVLQSGINALLVLIMILLNVSLSINYIAITVVLGMAGSSIYLVRQKNLLLGNIGHEMYSG